MDARSLFLRVAAGLTLCAGMAAFFWRGDGPQRKLPASGPSKIKGGGRSAWAGPGWQNAGSSAGGAAWRQGFGAMFSLQPEEFSIAIHNFLENLPPGFGTADAAWLLARRNASALLAGGYFGNSFDEKLWDKFIIRWTAKSPALAADFLAESGRFPGQANATHGDHILLARGWSAVDARGLLAWAKAHPQLAQPWLADHANLIGENWAAANLPDMLAYLSEGGAEAPPDSAMRMLRNNHGRQAVLDWLANPANTASESVRAVAERYAAEE